MTYVKKYWVIEVPAWGTLYAFGTESEAEEWRRHKANWEQSVARKREATIEEMESHKFESLTKILGGQTEEGWAAHHGETK